MSTSTPPQLPCQKAAFARAEILTSGAIAAKPPWIGCDISAPIGRTCPHFGYGMQKTTPHPLHSRQDLPICAATICCAAKKEMGMANAIERVIDWMLGPFARELARMPASSFRYLLNGL